MKQPRPLNPLSRPGSQNGGRGWDGGEKERGREGGGGEGGGGGGGCTAPVFVFYAFYVIFIRVIFFQ